MKQITRKWLYFRKVRLWALSNKILFPIYRWLHWGWPRKVPYPGASRGKWLDGLKEEPRLTSGAFSFENDALAICPPARRFCARLSTGIPL